MVITPEEHDLLTHAEELLRRLSKSGQFPLGMSFDMLKIADFLKEDLSPLCKREG